MSEEVDKKLLALKLDKLVKTHHNFGLIVTVSDYSKRRPLVDIPNAKNDGMKVWDYLMLCGFGSKNVKWIHNGHKDDISDAIDYFKRKLKPSKNNPDSIKKTE